MSAKETRIEIARLRAIAKRLRAEAEVVEKRATVLWCDLTIARRERAAAKGRKP